MVLGEEKRKQKKSKPKKKKFFLGLSHHQYGLLPPENMVYARVKISPSGAICSILAKPQGACAGRYWGLAYWAVSPGWEGFPKTVFVPRVKAGFRIMCWCGKSTRSALPGLCTEAPVSPGESPFSTNYPSQADADNSHSLSALASRRTGFREPQSNIIILNFPRGTSGSTGC